jgi:hypothetical protein
MLKRIGGGTMYMHRTLFRPKSQKGSVLDRASGRSWKSPQAAAIAARLVRLLPHVPAAANAAAGAAIGRRRRPAYWWVLLALSLALSFMLLGQQERTTIRDAVSGATRNDVGPSTAGSEPQSR